MVVLLARLKGVQGDGPFKAPLIIDDGCTGETLGFELLASSIAITRRTAINSMSVKPPSFSTRR